MNATKPAANLPGQTPFASGPGAILAAPMVDESKAIAIDLAVHQAKLDGRWERMREERALALQISHQTSW